MWRNYETLEKGYRYFMSAYESTIVGIIEKNTHVEYLDSIQDAQVKEEMTQLWSDIQANCKEIIDESVSLLH